MLDRRSLQHPVRFSELELLLCLQTAFHYIRFWGVPTLPVDLRCRGQGNGILASAFPSFPKQAKRRAIELWEGRVSNPVSWGASGASFVEMRWKLGLQRREARLLCKREIVLSGATLRLAPSWQCGGSYIRARWSNQLPPFLSTDPAPCAGVWAGARSRG